MARKNLKTLFHMEPSTYREEYERRFQDADTIHLKVNVAGNEAFICETPAIYKRIISIIRLDRDVSILSSNLPGAALDQFRQRCLIDEILLTSDIEGVQSTRRELLDILQDLSIYDRRKRFVGLMLKYETLMQGKQVAFQTCQDIRNIYDDIFFEEVKATNPADLPDGEIFRKASVSVHSASQREIHRGLLPESKIIQAMEQSLAFLNDESVEILIRIAAFHYLFGYIHPFYDGNGRTSRFISSYLLSQCLNPLIGFRLSYTIKENISRYYGAFKICNDPRNMGELTPFVETFLDIVDISMRQLLQTLQDKMGRLHYYQARLQRLPEASAKGMENLYFYLLQAALFSNVGIGWEELIQNMNASENTVRRRMQGIPTELLIKNRRKGKHYYLLNLEAVDRLTGPLRETLSSP